MTEDRGGRWFWKKNRKRFLVMTLFPCWNCACDHGWLTRIGSLRDRAHIKPLCSHSCPPSVLSLSSKGDVMSVCRRRTRICAYKNPAAQRNYWQNCGWNNQPWTIPHSPTKTGSLKPQMLWKFFFFPSDLGDCLTRSHRWWVWLCSTSNHLLCL